MSTTNNIISISKSENFFRKVTAYPKTVLIITFLSILGIALFIPRITKDTSSEAFIPKDHAAVVYRKKVKDIFGLSDPVVVAIVNRGTKGIFNPHSLYLIDWLTKRIADIDGIDPERIKSLSTENNIVNLEGGMLVQPFLEEPITRQEEADGVRKSVMSFPLYVGSMVSENGHGTLIIAELLDNDKGATVYADLLKLAANAPVDKEEEIYVAGEAAVVEYLGKYIDTDIQRLNPIIGAIVAIILFFAYRTLPGILLPNLVLIASVVFSLGAMACTGTPFYIITGALPVILIAISVADGIHILGEFYENSSMNPSIGKREIIVATMSKMWRPVTITSLSDIFGFMGLSLASFMPPVKAFGVFASIGVAAALLISLFSLPAGIMFFRTKPGKVFKRRDAKQTLSDVDKFGAIMGRFGRFVSKRSGWILIITCCVIVVGVVGTLRIKVNESRIENFKHSEPIYKADNIINNIFDGTNYLDIVIETPETEGLFDTNRLKRMEALQDYMKTLPHVKSATSIVDYLKQMNRAVNDGLPEAYQLPKSSDLVAQYFLLYSMNGNSTDFENEIDYEYRLANIRVTMNSGLYTDIKVVVEAAQLYIENSFNTQGLTATLAGRQNVNYHWIKQIGNSHYRGVVIAFFAVLLITVICFRSITAGLLAMLPVSLAVLIIYAVMGFSGIWLGVGTSMFAAIAIGLGVDFAVHVIDRLILVVRDEGKTIEEAFEILFPSTGRALLFSFAAVFFGFGVLIFSQALPLVRFGILVLIAVIVSFIASLTILPAIIKTTKPKFLAPKKNTG